MESIDEPIRKDTTVTAAPTSPTRSLRTRWTAVALAAAVTAGTGTVIGLNPGGIGPATAAAPVPAVSDASPAPAPLDVEQRTELVREQVQRLVDAGYPSASAALTDPDGVTTSVSAGIGDLATGAPAPLDGEVRVASNTKMFVSTVVLQLVDEGSVSLDEPVETYLPGLVQGKGIDGGAITVRQLLQHTSGLPEYVGEIAADAFAVQHAHISPRDMLDVALDSQAVFAPGERWEYSNTNYLVLGMLVERLTERPLYEEIDRRIVEPLHLDHTYLPVPGEQELRGEHPRGYHVDADGELKDISTVDPSYAWSAGAMVSAPSELNTFMQALLGGELISTASLTELQRAVPAGDELWPVATYGLGLLSFPLPDGSLAWGHGGDIPGTQTRNAVGQDGTAVTVAVSALPWAIVDPADEDALMDRYRIVVDALETLLEEAR